MAISCLFVCLLFFFFVVFFFVVVFFLFVCLFSCVMASDYYCPGRWFIIVSGIICVSLPTVRASILYKSIAGRSRPVSYPDGPITARSRFIKNSDWGDVSHMRQRNPCGPNSCL